MNNPFSQALDDIADKGWTVIPDFLEPDIVDALLEEQKQLVYAGAFKQAGIGKGDRFQIRPEIRSDHVLWMEPGELTDLQKVYWNRIQELRHLFNQEFYLGLKSYECHFALYPPGSFYKRHLDQHKGTQHRIISCVFYLNKQWKPEDGGRLRIYAGNSLEHFIDIDPLSGSLVLFKSDEIYHEVLPTHQERYSITGWLRVSEGAL